MHLKYQYWAKAIVHQKACSGPEVGVRSPRCMGQFTASDWNERRKSSSTHTGASTREMEICTKQSIGNANQESNLNYSSTVQSGTILVYLFSRHRDREPQEGRSNIAYIHSALVTFLRRKRQRRRHDEGRNGQD